MGWAEVAKLKGTGTIIHVAQPPLRLAQMHVSKRDAKADSSTIAVGRPDMMNLWL